MANNLYDAVIDYLQYDKTTEIEKIKKQFKWPELDERLLALKIDAALKGDNEMDYLIARQRCNNCGFEFDIMYFEDGNYEYIEGQEPCECEDGFSPCDGVLSISEWLESIGKEIK